MTTYFSKQYATTAAIAAGATSTEVFISEADENDNAPFDEIAIYNDDVVQLEIILDNSPVNHIVVPKNSFRTVHDARFRNFSIKNNDASAAHTLGTVKINVQNTKFPRRK